MKRSFLSIFFILICACRSPEYQQRPYYDLYDEAVNLYFKAPRDAEGAIEVLHEGCRRNLDLQDVTCYNLGVLLEIDGKTQEAREAYERARQLNPHPLYLAALRALDPGSHPPENRYGQELLRMVGFCREGRPRDAVRIMEQLVALQAEENSGIRLNQEQFAQPYFADCLAEQPAYAVLLAGLPVAGDLENTIVRLRAAHDEFHNLWDMESYFRGLQNHRGHSSHALTAAWQGILKQAGAGNAAATAAGLRTFFARLEAFPAASDQEREMKTAMRRAAAILVNRDPYFSRVRGSGVVQAVVAPLLR